MCVYWQNVNDAIKTKGDRPKIC